MNSILLVAIIILPFPIEIIRLEDTYFLAEKTVLPLPLPMPPPVPEPIPGCGDSDCTEA
jgi:hypothetical protein